MMQTDIRNNPLSGATPELATRYNQLLQDYVDYRSSLFGDLKALCKDAPQFAMAQLFKGYLLLSMGTNTTVDAALSCASAAEQNNATLTPGETLHCSALKAWARGDTTGAINLWEKIISEHHHDLLAIKLHHFALFWSGEPKRMLSVCQQIAPDWDAEIPGYANLLGMLAFAEEELGRYDTAEKYAREAIDHSPDDLWSVHALAHIFEMQGRLDEGVSLLRRPLDAYDDRNPFRGHLWWHLGMFMVEKGNYDQALALYDDAIYADESSFYLDLQNTASILARIEFCGIDVGERWLALGDAVRERAGDHILAFTEPHHTMILARCGDFSAIEQQIASLEALATDENRSIKPLLQPLLIPLCKAVRDYYQSAYASAAAELARLQPQLQPIGGSHAQRDIFSLMQIQSLINQEDFSAAEKQLELRLQERANSAINWQQYDRVSSALGRPQQVEKAQAELRRIATAA